MFTNRLLLTALVVVAAPAAAQEVVELPAEDRWLEADFAEVFSLGSLHAAEWQHFGMLQAAAFDAAGNLHLLDVDARTIVVVDPTGGFLRTIGQSGNGPGEFDFPRNLAILPDGRIVVSDIPRHRTFQIFNSDGSFDRGVRVWNDILAVAGRIDADRGSDSGVFVAAGDLVRYLPMRPEEHEDPPGKRSVLRLSLEGDELAQEVVAYGWAPPYDGPLEVRLGGRTISMGETTPPPRIFDPGFFVGALPGGDVAFSDSSAYRIKITGTAVGIARILSRPFEPEPVTDRVLEDEIERQLEEVARTAVAGSRRKIATDGSGNPILGLIPDDMIREGAVRAQRMFLEARPAAEEVPVVRSLRTTWDGEIWVQRRGDEPVSDGPIDVLTPGGRYFGQLSGGDADARRIRPGGAGGIHRDRGSGAVHGASQKGAASGQASEVTEDMTSAKHRLWLIGAAALAVASPASANPQSGTIAYTRGTTVDVDVPPEIAEVRDRFAEAREKSFLLHFDSASSLMVPAAEVEREESRPAVIPMTHNNLDALADIFEHEAASPENVLTHAYSGSGGAGAVRVFEVFQTLFRMDRAPLDNDWQVTDDQRLHLSHRVTRATARLNGGEVVAWFAPDIPVPGGPALYGGLPGMILVLALNSGNTIYAATAVSLDGADGEIVPPEEEGRVMTREEYESFVSDGIRDMRRSLRRLRNQARHLQQCAFRVRSGRLALSCFDPRGGF